VTSRLGTGNCLPFLQCSFDCEFRFISYIFYAFVAISFYVLRKSYRKKEYAVFFWGGGGGGAVFVSFKNKKIF
jgi:hypothetical protein